MFQSLLSRFGVALLIAMLACSSLTWGGNLPSNYKVLSPISHGNLTIFPVVAASTHDTSGFITLDEGIRSGEVVVTEAGRIGGVGCGAPRGGPGQFGSPSKQSCSGKQFQTSTHSAGRGNRHRRQAGSRDCERSSHSCRK